jgi:hypothetical protein
MRNSVALIIITLFLGAFFGPHTALPSDFVYSPNCDCTPLPQQCIIRTQNFISNFVIEKTENSGEYAITGTSKYLGSLESSQLKNVKLWFLILDKDVVVDRFEFKMGNLTSEFTFVFGRSFKTEKPFDSVSLV